MIYELAKLLKNAGFPQEKTEFRFCTDLGEKTYSKTCEPYPKAECGVHIAFPTLSELIEACGDGFKGLFPPQDNMIIKGMWLAVRERGEIIGDLWQYWTFCTGETPEEAVANLYLALHEKKEYMKCECKKVKDVSYVWVGIVD